MNMNLREVEIVLGIFAKCMICIDENNVTLMEIEAGSYTAHNAMTKYGLTLHISMISFIHSFWKLI